MFATPDLAARIDRAEGRLCAQIARAAAVANPDFASDVIAIGGGVAVFAGPGSPTNKMIGVGFGPDPTVEDLERVEAAFASRAAPFQAEVSTLADPALHRMLIARGYEPRGFENVLGHPLAHVESARPAQVTVGLTKEDELQRWLALTMTVSGIECISAAIDHRLVGGGALRFDDRIAQLCGVATLPAFRRRGVQSAVLRWRLNRARSAGCEAAVVTTQPASKSQQNVQREGFHLLYARQLLVKTP